MRCDGNFVATFLCFWVEIKKNRYWNCCSGPSNELFTQNELSKRSLRQILYGSHIKIWNLANHIKKQNKKHQDTRSIDKKLETKSLMFLVSFFHVICKIILWTAKHLAQASCTELTLPKQLSIPLNKLPWAKRYLESWEKAREITSWLTNSAHLSTFLRLRSSKSKTTTWGRSPRSAKATNLRFLFTPSEKNRQIKQWYFVTKIVLTYCEEKLF